MARAPEKSILKCINDLGVMRNIEALIFDPSRITVYWTYVIPGKETVSQLVIPAKTRESGVESESRSL